MPCLAYTRPEGSLPSSGGVERYLEVGGGKSDDPNYSQGRPFRSPRCLKVSNRNDLLLLKVQDNIWLQIKAEGKRLRIAYLDSQGVLRFSDRAATAPIIHVNGPLRMDVQDKQSFVRGEATTFAAVMGTPGLGKGTFAALGYQHLGENIHPSVTLKFPGENSRMPNRVAAFSLTHRC